MMIIFAQIEKKKTISTYFLVLMDGEWKNGKFGCMNMDMNMNGLDSDMMKLTPFLAKMASDPKNVEMKMTLNHAGLSMHTEANVDKEVLKNLAKLPMKGARGKGVSQFKESKNLAHLVNIPGIGNLDFPFESIGVDMDYDLNVKAGKAGKMSYQGKMSFNVDMEQLITIIPMKETNRQFDVSHLNLTKISSIHIPGIGNLDSLFQEVHHSGPHFNQQSIEIGMNPRECDARVYRG